MCTVFWKQCFRSHRKIRSLPSFRHSYIPPYLYPHHRKRFPVSLRLGHATALTVHRTVIHYRVDTALPLNHSGGGLVDFFLAAPLGEVASAVCAEVGEVYSDFCKLSFIPSDCFAQSPPLATRGGRIKFSFY